MRTPREIYRRELRATGDKQRAKAAKRRQQRRDRTAASRDDTTGDAEEPRPRGNRPPVIVL